MVVMRNKAPPNQTPTKTDASQRQKTRICFFWPVAAATLPVFDTW